MMNRFQVIFSGVIAYILLGLYAISVGYMIYMVVTKRTATFPAGLTDTVTLIGGLISALVIGQLAHARTGQPPAVPTAAAAAGGGPDRLNVGLTVLYMVVWLLAGLAALVVGVLLFPDVNKTLSSIGTTWLGLAVAASYAYFGLNQQEPPQQPQ